MSGSDGNIAREPIIGIDLGTTNSLVAVCSWPIGDAKAVAPRILPDALGRTLCPSVVRFDSRRPPVVGHEAAADAVEFPLNTISSAKRLMGRSLADVAGDLGYLSYRVVAGEHNTARIELPFVPFRAGSDGGSGGDGGDGRGCGNGGGDDRGDGNHEKGASRLVSPQEVSALILRQLRDQASLALGVPVRKAVITVPAYFDDAQRQATRDAARLAGLEAVRIVAEPTAAALAYGLGLRSGSPRRPSVVVVYDLGGGTFDVSVLRITPAVNGAALGADAFQVLSTVGDTHLGGDDFDYALVRLFTSEIAAKFFNGDDIAASLSPAVRRAHRDFAERTKIRLSEHNEARVRIDLGADEAGSPRVYERTITRVEFESLIDPMVQRTLTACKRAMRDAKRQMEGETIDAVIMVGGSTRVPIVRQRVRELFSLEPYVALDPDLVVALGAAVQASVLSGVTTDAMLLDVIPLSLGIETAGGAFAKILMRNSTIPASAHEMFSTQVDGQTAIKLHVLQGEREMASDCRSLGQYELRGIPAMPAGIPQLRVDFRIDANGVLGVSALERRSGKRLDVQIVPNHGLGRDEIARMEAASLTHAREDMRRHRIADLTANAKLDLHWIAKQLERLGAELPEQQRESILNATNGLRGFVAAAESAGRESANAASGNAARIAEIDADAYQMAKETLDRASIPLHELSIAKSLQGESTRDG